MDVISDRSNGDALADRSGSRKSVWIDVSGILRWGAQPPTGIQRVELSILSFAGTQDDIGFVYFDDDENRHFPVTPEMTSYLEFIATASDWASGRENYWTGIRNATAFFPLQMKFAKKETVRRLADALTGYRGRNGLLYELTKAIIRPFFWVLLVVRWIARKFKTLLKRMRVSWLESASDGKSVLLVAHYPQLDRKGKMLAALADTNIVAVHIIYDLIPILLPETVPPHFTERMDKFLRQVLRAGHPLIAISNVVERDIMQWNAEFDVANYDKCIKVCHLNSGFDPKDATGVPIRQLEGKKFAVFCSTTEKRKRHDMLVAAWAALAGSLPADQVPDLLFIGRSHPSGRPAIDAELAKAPQLAGKVHLMSGIGDDQLRWAYRNAMLGLFPSSQEGWGLGVSECLAYGLPVVHSDIPILHEAAQDTMPSAPVGDVDAWVTVLADLFANPGKIEALREKIKTDYEPGTPDGFARCIVSHLRMIAEHGVEILKK